MARPLPPHSRVCFFAHYDADDTVDSHVLWYLRALAALRFAIIFVSASSVDRGTQAALSAMCHDVILRENKGHDFASWAAAFDRYGPMLQADLLLTNDSVYGPIGSLESALERLLATSADFCGMVESFDRAPHLQSWFLMLRPPVYRSSAFRSIMALPFAKMTKKQIIDAGEIGLTQALVASEFNYAAAFPASRTNLVHATPNPSHYQWREMLVNGKVPFIKVELLRDNPANVTDLAQWPNVVEGLEPEIAPFIRQHLSRHGDKSTKPWPLSRRLLVLPFSRHAFFMRDQRLARADRRFLRRANALAHATLHRCRRGLRRAFRLLRHILPWTAKQPDAAAGRESTTVRVVPSKTA